MNQVTSALWLGTESYDTQCNLFSLWLLTHSLRRTMVFLIKNLDSGRKKIHGFWKLCFTIYNFSVYFVQLFYHYQSLTHLCIWKKENSLQNYFFFFFFKKPIYFLKEQKLSVSHLHRATGQSLKDFNQADDLMTYSAHLCSFVTWTNKTLFIQSSEGLMMTLIPL